jgi:hypothetical protein
MGERRADFDESRRRRQRGRRIGSGVGHLVGRSSTAVTGNGAATATSAASTRPAAAIRSTSRGSTGGASASMRASASRNGARRDGSCCGPDDAIMAPSVPKVVRAGQARGPVASFRKPRSGCPEPITADRGYGFRARAFGAPRNDTERFSAKRQLPYYFPLAGWPAASMRVAISFASQPVRPARFCASCLKRAGSDARYVSAAGQLAVPFHGWRST